MSEFPCWRYSASAPARIFANAVELEAAGDGWVDSPAKLVAVEPAAEPVVEPIAEAVEPAVEPAGVSPAPESDGLDDMDKVDLQALCTERGIEFDGRNSRLTLIAKLRGQE